MSSGRRSLDGSRTDRVLRSAASSARKVKEVVDVVENIAALLAQQKIRDNKIFSVMKLIVTQAQLSKFDTPWSNQIGGRGIL